MRKSAVAALMVTGALALGGCAEGQQGGGGKRVVGAVAGAAIGGLLGSHMGGHHGGNVITTAMGVFIGGLIGHEIGRSMDQADQARAKQAMSQAQAAPIGETVEWENPKSGNSGSYTPVRDGRSSSGRYCREFQQTVTIGGKTEQAYGTACRQPDGSWQIVET